MKLGKLYKIVPGVSELAPVYECPKTVERDTRAFAVEGVPSLLFGDTVCARDLLCLSVYRSVCVCAVVSVCVPRVFSSARVRVPQGGGEGHPGFCCGGRPVIAVWRHGVCVCVCVCACMCLCVHACVHVWCMCGVNLQID